MKADLNKEENLNFFLENQKFKLNKYWAENIFRSHRRIDWLTCLKISLKIRDENPTGPGFGPGPKTLIFLNFKNPEPGPKPECDFPETLNPNPNPNFKNLGPAENPVFL